MRLIFYISFIFLLASCSSTTYYIVRHAEKETSGAMMLSDPPLTSAGEKQAIDLKNFLQQKKIKHIYSTNYARTVSTAEPTRQFFGLTLTLYDPRKNEELVEKLKQINDGNVLIVGHSNTVDDVVNSLLGKTQMSDLADSDYGQVFIVKRKGNQATFEKTAVPQTAARTAP